MTDTIFVAVTEQLINRGWNATYEYPGVICVKHGDLIFDFGTADGQWWSGDVEDFASSGVVGTDVPAECDNVLQIADALHKAVRSCLPTWEDCSGELNTYNQIAIRKGREVKVIADMPYLAGIGDDAEVWVVGHKLAEAVASALNKLEAR